MAKLKKLEDKMAKDGSKGQELAAELARLQEDVPALQARAADLELQLAKAQEVSGWVGGRVGPCWETLRMVVGHAVAALLRGGARPGQHRPCLA
jgi:hypothetical protein